MKEERILSSTSKKTNGHRGQVRALVYNTWLIGGPRLIVCRLVMPLLSLITRKTALTKKKKARFEKVVSMQQLYNIIV